MTAAHRAVRSPRRPHTDAELAVVGLKTFFLIAERWGLSNEEARMLLGQPPRSTFYRWKRGEIGAVSRDMLERLSHLLAIYQALHTIFSDDSFADEWVRRPSTEPLFDGRSALDRMLDGSVGDLAIVRQYVAAHAAGNYGW